jgi:2-keto-myo-inositol isomerase
MRGRATRRQLLARSGAALGAGVAAGLAPRAAAAAPRPKAEPFRYSLNTSTLRGQRLSLPDEVEIAARAGYDAIEPWVEEIDRYVQGGGSLPELRKRIGDHGLTVESAIAFPEWIVDDDARRARGLEEARRSMERVAQIGGRRLAAPPAGATDGPGLDLLKVAERYRALLELGAGFGVAPQVEIWGFSRNLRRLGEAALVAIESGHPLACILPDVFHLYKGSSAFGGVKLLSGTAIHVIHVNDYPARPPRETITDADRVYPGDGVAPLAALFHDLAGIGFRGVLSLELFNREYWKQDALTVARTGLEKTRALVRRNLTR